MTDIRVMEEAIAQAREKLATWREEYDRGFYKPLAETLTTAMYSQLPPEVRDQLQSLAPGAVRQMDERVRGNDANSG